MFRKLALVCIAAAALGAAALTPSAASAREWRSVGVLGGGGHGGWHGGHSGWHGGHHHHHHRGWGGRGWGAPSYFAGGGYGGCYVRRLVPTPYGYRERLVNRCY
ncbi:putative membrane protein [Afipia massiliensis]|uniref:Putative membrane protein n=1 Tax=Afipia massiliensis TaxID=211460 RepID=A0A840MSF3_9BRAD|nr:sulfur globule protein precursor [Afipia massiliensis]MBB5051339.1 putative membrane protein [Afipia massiliensis]